MAKLKLIHTLLNYPVHVENDYYILNVIVHSIFHSIFSTVYSEFERLLQEQAPLEAYMEWLDAMVNACVIQVGQH